jgi:hypothetical protein
LDVPRVVNLEPVNLRDLLVEFVNWLLVVVKGRRDPWWFAGSLLSEDDKKHPRGRVETHLHMGKSHDHPQSYTKLLDQELDPCVDIFTWGR